MLRNILAIIAGMVSGSVAVAVMEKLGHYFYPFPKGMRPDDMEGFKDYVANLPLRGLLLVIVGYALAAFVVGFVATKISKNNNKIPAIICGLIFLLFTIYNMIVLPTPIWFWVLGIAVWGLVFVGIKLAINKKSV